MSHDTPRITALRVIPVAGRDGMLLNLSGAHAPFFTRNLLILTDSAGRTGVGEVVCVKIGSGASCERFCCYFLRSKRAASSAK